MKKEKSLVDDNQGVEDCINNVFRTKVNARKVFGLWNRLAKEVDIKSCSFLSDPLKRRIEKNVKRFPASYWRRVFLNILESEFLFGKGWFSLDWAMKEDNFVKIHDGNYIQEGKEHLPGNAVGSKKSVQKMLRDWKEKSKK